MGTRWCEDLLDADTAEPGKHVPPHPDQLVVYPTRPPIMWLDSYCRFRGYGDDIPNGRIMDHLRWWGESLMYRYRYPGSVRLDWWAFLQDPVGYRETVEAHLGVETQDTDEGWFGSETGPDYYLGGEHLESLGGQAVLQARKTLSSSLSHVCETFGYPTEPMV